MVEAVGSDMRLRDARARVVGTLEFVLDHRVDRVVHAKAVRSPVPHARIAGYHVADALDLPGVLAVVTGADVAGDESIDPYFGTPRADQPLLAIDKVRYAGEPVAIVVAETREQATQAAAYVDVEYEELPYVTDADDAAGPDAPQIHERWPDNNCGSWKLRHGNCQEALEQAAHVFSDTYYSPPASHVPMEPFVCVAEWQEDDGLEVWTSAQAPHAVREGLERMFRLPQDGVRVRTKNLGGGYGAKGQVKIEPMVAYAARVAGRPVRMELARDEVFQTVGKHAARVRLTTGVDEHGKIVARRVSVNYNAGAYAITSVGASGQGLTRANGPYTIPNVDIDSVATYTNTVPTGPFRGAMTSQLAFAYESQIDDIAARLGLDPVQIRKRNVLRDGDVYPTGEAMHDMHYADMLDDLAEAVDWGARPSPAGPRKARGKGLAVIIKNTLTPSRSEARIEVTSDGDVHLYSSSVEMGQGASATIVQIAADCLGLEPDRIALGFPDTRYTPFDTTTSSSRTTYSMGQAIERAAEDLQERLSKMAGTAWNTSPGDLQHVAGEVHTPDSDRRAPWGEVIRAAGLTGVSGHGVYATDFGVLLMEDPHDVKGPVTAHWHQGGAAAEIEVDLDTGRIDVLRMHAACFAGRVVSPLRVHQQNQGCVVMGLGPTLFEELHYQDGTLSNPNLSDYMIPSIVDVPPVITSTAIESSDNLELHGVGEMALPAVSPAVANALFAATGVRLTELPLTPERVLRALEEHEAAHEERVT